MEAVITFQDGSKQPQFETTTLFLKTVWQIDWTTRNPYNPDREGPFSETSFVVFLGIVVLFVILTCLCFGRKYRKDNDDPIQNPTVCPITGADGSPSYWTVYPITSDVSVTGIALHTNENGNSNQTRSDLPPAYDDVLMDNTSINEPQISHDDTCLNLDESCDIPPPSYSNLLIHDPGYR